MSRHANPTVVGAFVVGALVLLVAGVLVFGSGAVLSERFPVVAFFSGNVRGLQEGSAVEFRGVRVGTVTQIRLVLDVDSNELVIPVHMELEPASLTLVGTTSGVAAGDASDFLDALVEQGLRARLDLKSFVTGQLAVGLDMHPGTTPVRLGAVADVYELPTVPSTLDRVAEVLQDLPLQDMAGKLIAALDSVEKLLTDQRLAALLGDAAGVASDTRRLLGELQDDLLPTLAQARATLAETREVLSTLGAHADTTLDEYTALAQGARARLESLAGGMERALSELGGLRATLDARLAPVADAATATLGDARGALGDARGALVNARELLAEDSRTRYNLDVTLEELAAAARSLRIMVDYLEQNPDALLKGKGL